MKKQFRPQSVNEVFRGAFKKTSLTKARDLADGNVTQKGDELYSDGQGAMVTGENLLSQMATGLSDAQKTAIGFEIKEEEGRKVCIVPDDKLGMVSYERIQTGNVVRIAFEVA